AARVDDRLVEPMDGRSLLRSWNRPWILTEFWPGTRLDVPAWASIRAPDRQYVEYYDDTRVRPVFREYYDLERDPRQRRNKLAGPVWSMRASPAETTRMSLELAVARSCRGTAPPRECP
ncbi:MAG TPA: hypothetical protein VG709_00655, partial [Actinomycetota bacterium]|nr:hypothetical protein [Actinomycetota bacterium]